jgi:hypothetical protein
MLLDGWFIYIDSSSNLKDEVARIRSIMITRSTSTISCMQFWYFMYGDDVGKLNMYITTGSSIFSNPTYSLIGTKGQYWINQKLSFTFSNNFDFDVSFLLFLLNYILIIYFSCF